MGTISRPGRSRHNSGRSLLSFRERESPKSPRVEKKVATEEVGHCTLTVVDCVFRSLLAFQIHYTTSIFHLQPKEPETTKEESDVDSDSPRKGRSTPRGREEPVSVPTTRKAMKDEANRTSTTKDKATPGHKEAPSTTKSTPKEGKATPAHKESPMKGDKTKPDDKKKADKTKDVKVEKDEEKSKASNKEDDAKKKKAVSTSVHVH